MQAEDTGDSITFLFESPSQDRHSDFELKLMDIDSEQCDSSCCVQLACNRRCVPGPQACQQVLEDLAGRRDPW